jgi:hypothetical protein
MSRQPIVGGDAGNWGNVLNDYLSVVLDTGGTLKSNTVGTSQISNGAVGATQANLPSLAGAILLSGTFANRPLAATSAGFYYFATDVSSGTIYQSDGSSWTQVTAGVTHAANHASGGSDPVSPSSIGGIATSIVTTKGDLIVATANNTVVRHGAGSNGQITLYDSTQTDGLRSVDLAIVNTFFMANTLTVKTGVSRQYFEAAYTVTNVRASVGTAPTGASVICDVNKNGTTIYSTQGNRPTITVSTNTATANSPDVTSIAAGDYLTVDVDQIGSTVAGADLTVSVTLRRA